MNDSITNIKDLDREVLLQLDDRELNRLCQVNIWMRELCMEEDFWKKKWERRFGDVWTEGGTYHDNYTRFASLDLDDILDSINNGEKDEVIYLLSLGARDVKMYRAAGERGDLDIINSILEKYNTSYSRSEIIEGAARGDNLHVLKYLNLLNSEKEDVMVLAATYNHLNIMKWLSYNYVDRLLIDNIIGRGDSETLDWLVAGGFEVTNPDMALVYHNYDAIDWFIDRGYEFDPVKLALEGYVNILEYLDEYPQLTQEQINKVALNGYYDTLEYLDVRPDEKTLKELMRRLETLDPDVHMKHYAYRKILDTFS